MSGIGFKAAVSDHCYL